MEIEKRLEELGIVLPRIRTPAANFVQYNLCGQFLFLAGAVPVYNDTYFHPGKLGREVSVEQGYEAARYCTLNHLAFAKEALGDLDRVEKVIQLQGFVAVAPGFQDMPKVVNGASDLWVELYGDRGRHVRIAMGVSEITKNIPVETQVTLLVRT
jgi:enamine deaminase RidA (YjgF/YER057c/UK114 family)